MGDWQVHSYLNLLFLLLFLLPPVASQAQSSVPQLSSDSSVATAGFFRLSWDTDAAQVELQEASDNDFRSARTYYKGADKAALISGKPNGDWYYRIRALQGDVPGPWSEPLLVTVVHHPLSRALLFFGLGLAVFIAIVVLVVRGPEAAS
jgi:hypothetical protein